MSEKKEDFSENLEFKAEVSRLLDIVANSLYSDREIFLRELISNSADACEKLRYLSTSNQNLIEKEDKFFININFSKKNNYIQISDNGIGMSKEELIENLGTIARSGTSKFLENIKNKDDISSIGQFGVGFYASYMVSNKVEVSSKKAGEIDSWKWESDGKNNFTLNKDSKKNKGTDVKLFIKKDSSEFLDFMTLSNIITKYSNYIPFPISLLNEDEKKNKPEKINEGEPLWLKNKKDIKEEDYNQFYKSISYNFDDPIKTIHFQAEGVLNYNSLLYFPSKQPIDLFNPDRKNKIKLYIQKIFITDDCENIIPNWLRFIPGVIDSKDISLNISREMLQNNPVIQKIKKGITNKVLNEIKLLLDKDKNKFIEFWKIFGAVIKEGLYENNEYQNKILEFTFFKSTINKEMISLDEYIEKSNDKQKEIFYFSNYDAEYESIIKSPQLEKFIEDKIPVLIMTDPVDGFWVNNINKYKEKEFKSITKGFINLDKDNKNKENTKESSKEINDLINLIKLELKDKIKDVRVSSRLTKSPLLLVADEEGMDINMEKIMKMHNQSLENNKKILEINPNHAMIIKISNSLSSIDHKKIANLIFDQANILDGNPVKNPSEYINNLTSLFIEK
ncbi:MAG: Chaperone protein HtpG [Alphaproteobacteria bacterium MarineAlpha5_Bin12]|nr:MAG: Chaperone protein HtpG [Alphaproteobacteria bacterium MarineAlpha5_Bin12]|tara:strand:- start:4024 stop:5886 length:1863 start_codon:yes stop_codon:yes gene_type:complete